MEEPGTKKSAWKDDADEDLEISLTAKKQRRKLRSVVEEDQIDGKDYERRLRSHYERMNPTPKWATDARKNLHNQSLKRRRSSVSSTEEDVEMDTPPLFTSTSDATSARTSSLSSGTLSIERLRDANQSSRSQGNIHSVEFHPNVNVPVLSVAGADRRLRLFNVSYSSSTSCPV
jgi:U3 small nucleolar RNA-associated protein 18